MMSRRQYAIHESYEGITPFFGLLSRLFESRARSKSLRLSAMQDGGTMLIVAPPTEFFIERLLTLNANGDNHLLYFSDGMKERAGFDPIEIAPCPQKGLPIELAGAEK
jgi:hypothetical protein